MDLPSVSRQALDFMINHVFLPPQLPQADDTNTEHIGATIRVLCHSVSRFLSLDTALQASMPQVLGMLQRFGDLEALQDGEKEGRLHDILSNLRDGGEYLLWKTQETPALPRTLADMVTARCRPPAPQKPERWCTPHNARRGCPV